MNEPDADYHGRLSIDNRDVASVLERTADLLEFNDENPFKLRSYRVAAETIAEMQQPLSEIAARGAAGLQELPGIGKSLSAQLLEILQTGTSSFFEELKEKIPESVLELRRVSGIGLKTSQMLYRDFGVKSLDELKAFVDGGGLESVSGLGDKIGERIKASLVRLESERGKVRLNEATDLANAILERLRAVTTSGAKTATRLEIVGQIRRGCEMVDHVEVLASGDAKALAQAFAHQPEFTEIKAQRVDRVEAVTKKDVAVTLYLAVEADFAAALVRTTGSSEHLRDLAAEAQTRGYAFKGFHLTETPARGERKRKAKAAGAGQSLRLGTEEEFYSALGLDFIAPELREGLGEVTDARNHQLPELICLEDMRGDFHMHTTWSDGQNSIREMIEAARRRGYQYIAITDHTQSTAIANGNTPDELLKEIAEIDVAASDYDDIRVFKGAEVDILSDGSLDMPFDVLDQLDWIVVSIHAGFQQPKAQITERVVRAMASGYPNVFAHPTGRILGERPGYEIDLEQVIAAAKKHNVRLELNASPYRLDLNSYWLRVARQAGVGFVISSDSHQTRGFEAMRYGIATARRAGLTKDDVLNTLPLTKLLAELKRKQRDRQT